MSNYDTENSHFNESSIAKMCKLYLASLRLTDYLEPFRVWHVCHKHIMFMSSFLSFFPFLKKNLKRIVYGHLTPSRCQAPEDDKAEDLTSSWVSILSHFTKKIIK
jgi:hypothetical protein